MGCNSNLDCIVSDQGLSNSYPPLDISPCGKIPPTVVQITPRPNDGGPTCPLNGGQMSPDVLARHRSSMMLLLQMLLLQMSPDVLAPSSMLLHDGARTGRPPADAIIVSSSSSSTLL